MIDFHINDELLGIKFYHCGHIILTAPTFTLISCRFRRAVEVYTNARLLTERLMVLLLLWFITLSQCVY